MKKTAKTMKKKKDWQTKEMKRKHKEQDKGVLGVMLADYETFFQASYRMDRRNERSAKHFLHYLQPV